MDSVEESDVVLSVTLGQHEQWNVTTQEFPHPLASFNNPQAACAWAIQRTKPKRSQVLIGEIPVVVG